MTIYHYIKIITDTQNANGAKLLGIYISFCLLASSCIKEKDLFSGEKIGVKQEITSNPEFTYKFNDENVNNTVEITIKTKEPINSNIKSEIPPLKYNKSWLFMLTQDDCKHAAFSCTWAAINGKPLSSLYYYDLAHLQQNDLPPDTYYLGKTLGSTDGTGNEVRFSFTTTLAPEWDWMNAKSVVYKGYTRDFYRFNMKNGLVWGNVKEMLNYGVGISLYDMNIANNVITADNLIGHFSIAQNIATKNLNGRGCKMLARPNGDDTYMEAAQNYVSLQTLVAESKQPIYPFQLKNNDLENVILDRYFYEAENIKSKIRAEMERAPEDRAAIHVGVHDTDATWIQFLLWLNNTYGKDGDDSVWMPSQEEFYEYNYYRTHGTTQCEQTDERTLKLTVKLTTDKEYFYYPSTTVNLSGLKMKDIVSIEPNNAVSGFSYANFKDGIMLNIDCRRFLFSHALKFVERYEADPTNASNRADAFYFVNMLKESSLKTKYLERLK